MLRAWLGKRVVDVLTGFKGTVTAVHEDIHGVRKLWVEGHVATASGLPPECWLAVERARPLGGRRKR